MSLDELLDARAKVVGIFLTKLEPLSLSSLLNLLEGSRVLEDSLEATLATVLSSHSTRNFQDVPELAPVIDRLTDHGILVERKKPKAKVVTRKSREIIKYVPRRYRKTAKEKKINSNPTDDKGTIMCDLCGSLVKFLDKHKESNCLKYRKEKLAPGAPLDCNVCGKTYTNQKSLFCHQKQHSGVTFNCDKCSYSSPHKRHFVLHKLTHGGQRPHQCDRCPKAFTTAYKLKLHMDIHDNFKRFKCIFCNDALSQPQYLREHVRRKHGVELPKKGDGGSKGRMFYAPAVEKEIEEKKEDEKEAAVETIKCE